MECCSSIVVLIIAFIAVILAVSFWNTQSAEEVRREAEEKRRREEEQARKKQEELERLRQIAKDEQEAINRYDNYLKEYTKWLINYFRSSVSSTQENTTLEELYGRLAVAYNKLPEYKRRNEVTALKKKEDILNAFQSMYRTADSCKKMIGITNYGKVNQQFWDSVKTMQENDIDTYLANAVRIVDTGIYSNLSNISVSFLLKCVWHYAIRKPYSAEKFHYACNVFRSYYKGKNLELFIAELYAIMQMSGSSVVSNKVNGVLLDYRQSKVNDSITEDIARSLQDGSPDNLIELASALMWMKAYNEERRVLQHMVENKKQLPPKLQERLHSLISGDGMTPGSFDYKSNSTTLYFDISSLKWEEKQFNSFFEQLVFMDSPLTYSLAVREDNKNLQVANSNAFPDVKKIREEVQKEMIQEYGSNVQVSCMKGIALSGNEKVHIDGILVNVRDYKSLGIFVYVLQMGKKINIKFYTLFMPQDLSVEIQKEKVMTLWKSINPTLNMWEESLKETILTGIQRLLNKPAQSEVPASNSKNSGDIEF